MLYYTLKQISTGFYPEMSITANGDDAEFCNSTTVDLYFTETPDVLWLVKAMPDIKAMKEVGWYNSCQETPRISDRVKITDLEIIEVNV